jgi:hypothetical protein
VVGEDSRDEGGAGALAGVGAEGVVDLEVEGRQRGRHRREMACVRAPSLVGRREMMVPRMASGRPLMMSPSQLRL